MRYLVTEEPYVIGEFVTGNTVTVVVYDMAGNIIPSAGNASEIATTGVFQWATSQLTNPIPVTGITTYMFVMDNGAGITRIVYKEWGGYPDLMVGLSQGNVYMDNCVYNATYGGLQSARIRIYDTAANVGTVTGVIATYNITAVITSTGQFSSWTQERL